MRLETWVSVNNSTASPLLASGTFEGEFEDCTGFMAVMIASKSDRDGTIYADFSPDGINVDSTLSFQCHAGIPELHRLTIGRRYCRIRYVNSAADQSYLRLQTTYGYFYPLSSPLNASITSDADAITARAIITGQTDSGAYVAQNMTPEGHSEVAIHSPRLPFGSVHTESLRPEFQTDAVYGVKTNQVTATSVLSGSATTSDSSFVCSTGTTVAAFGSIQSRKRLRYRSGQGVVGRFTARFTGGVAQSILVAGLGHAEDGVYIGYNGTQFGILYSQRGVREVQTLTITTASSTTENITVTLANTNFSVPVTNSANIQRTVYEISTFTYTGWKAEAVGATVVFIRDSVGNASGTFSISGTTVVGTFAETKAGVAATEEWIYQADFNGDPLDGTGNSGFTIDPTKGNVFQIGIQYLGNGAITFKVETVAEDNNNPEFVTFHTIKLPNTLTKTSFGNPSFPFTMAAYSAGSTTNVSVACGSFAGFIEGPKILHGNRFSYFNQSTAVTALAYRALFTVRNTRYYSGRSNQAVINLISISAAVKHTQPVTIYVIRNATLVGNPNFSQYSTESCSYYDQTATTCTFSTNDQIIWSGQVGETGNIQTAFADEITIQPGESMTVAAIASTGTPAYVLATLNTREDQ